MTFSSWIKQQYAEVKKLLTLEEVKLLELISDYEGFQDSAHFIMDRLRTELSYYRNDLRFSRWIEKKRG